MRIQADTWNYNEKNGIAILGFLNETEQKYVLIQKTINYTKEDKESGIASHYIEFNDQRFGAYNAIERIDISDQLIQIYLKPNAIKDVVEEFLMI